MEGRYIGVLKTNHRLFPKKQIEEWMCSWPAGSRLVLEAFSPKGKGIVILTFFPTVGYCDTEQCCDISEESTFGDPHFFEFQIILPTSVSEFDFVGYLKVLSNDFGPRYALGTPSVQVLLNSSFHFAS